MRTLMTGLMLVAATVLTACVENAATGGTSFSLLGESGERALGEQTAQSEVKRYSLYSQTSPATRYVTDLCQRMFAVTEGAEKMPVSCILLDSADFNAWATPGYINVYRGILPYMNSEADLASVLGHESGHIAARHVAQNYSRGVIASVLVAAGGIYASSQMGDDTARVATQLGSLAAAGAMASFSREFEHEADALAQRYLPRAGYDPREAVNMISAMQTHDAYMQQYMQAVTGKPVSRNGLEKWFSSHPATPDRLAAAVKTAGPPDGGVQLPAGITPATPPDDPQGQKRFYAAIDGLNVGPKVAWGVVGRNHLTLPRARMRLSIPDGFVLTYVEGAEDPAAGQWLGGHQASGVLVAVRTLVTTSGQNAGNVLMDKVSGVEASSVRRLAVRAPEGTREAYTGTGRNNEGKPQRYVAISIPEAHPSNKPEEGRVVVVGFTYPDAATQQREEQAILQSIGQSEVLGASAAQKVQPLKLGIITAGVGDSVARLAAKMPQGTLREEWFRTLNNLPAGEVVVGRKYKVVVDPNL